MVQFYPGRARPRPPHPSGGPAKIIIVEPARAPPPAGRLTVSTRGPSTEGAAVKLDEILTRAGDTITVRRVFAEPYDHDGVTIIPSATVSGGGGGGGGRDPGGQEGEGGGFGVNARPAGAFVIRNGKVRWRPAVDVNRMMAIAGMVTIAVLVTRVRMRRLGGASRR
jgi:uncharacterized spore protein YtfJ